ncbi:cyclophane-forming radical SAM/SPASM peptide maturase GrrM/OscB [Roseobacter sp. MH60115]|uniref:cyclophane-forming radical SAM/SPASM peptide maturase GrrM/OscB n=1 Tax=Roseobacter sp. MH60115 TaxID=2785324 RepID=UPI0018A2B433|nr:cyclophane-forming radical SAM/SPASM peptide maturase GrrM/OscB [Roseobacter sp. MH60115]
MEQLEQLGKLVKSRQTPSLLVLQPTSYCNLDCSYCYLQHRDDRARMSDETLRAIARNIIAPCPPDERPLVVWHGGEPMTLPAAWYAQAFALLEEEGGGPPLRHAFQTNAVGVNASWIDLWRTWKVNIGVSLDGPADLHDSRRRTRRGKGSHALAMRGVSRLQEAGLPFHVITVLTAQSLSRADDIYDFFTGQGIRNVAFNVEEEEGQEGGSSLLATSQVAAGYTSFLKQFLHRCAVDPEPFHCREIEGVKGLLAAPHDQRAENWQVDPFRIVTVGVQGGLSTFSPELIGATAPDYDDFVFGNVRDGGVQSMRDSDAFRRASDDIARGVAACAAECRFFEVCGGGAPANKYFELGRFDGTETLHCRLTRQITLETVLDALDAGVFDHSSQEGFLHDRSGSADQRARTGSGQR